MSESVNVDVEIANVNTNVSVHLPELSESEKAHLAADKIVLSDFKQTKLEKEAAKNWDLFYKRNGKNFFKDRHWTSREVKALCPEMNFEIGHVLFEAGCGVGNFLFPFLQEHPNWTAFACDFSARAVKMVQEHVDYAQGRCSAFECDLTNKEQLYANVPSSSVHLCFLVFVLSAIHPDNIPTVTRNLATCIRPGGSVIVRDYGRHDHAQLRFSKGHKLADNFYVRQDGTRSYYFAIDELSGMFVRDGLFKVSSCEYLCRRTTNKREEIDVPRRFVQARFIRTELNQDNVND